MINRSLIQALNSPWLIEPTEAQKWANFVMDLLQPSAVANPVSKYSNEESVPYVKGSVFVLPVTGPMMKYDNCGSPGTANMISSLQQANADPNITGIVLQINSPGGTVDGTKVFADAVKSSKKPVVAYVDGMMASAAMWVGSAAKEIIASTATDMVGSIGTMMQWADFTEAYKQRGIKVHTAFATASTDKNRMLANAEATGNYTELITKVLDPVNNEFLKSVQSNRAGKIDIANENVLTGKTYMAKEAMKYGLVDKIGSLDYAIKRVQAIAQQQQQQKMENNTPFKMTLSVANAEAFELVDNIGFGLTEDQLNSIEAKLAENEQTITQLNEQLQQSAASVTEANEAVSAANALIAQKDEEINALKAQVDELKKSPAGSFSATGKAADEIDGKETQPVSTVTEEANRKRAMLGLKPVF